jgi:hypothetical protein
MYPSDLVLQTLTLAGVLGLGLEGTRRLGLQVMAWCAASPPASAEGQGRLAA